MRHLILIAAAAVFFSASAQAGGTRGRVTLASHDVAETSQTAADAKPTAPAETSAETKPEAKKDAAKVGTKTDAKTETKTSTAKSAAPVTRKRETDEQKARRIAARYGISW